MIEALNRGMEAGAWAFGALLIFGLGVLLVALGIAGLGWAFGDGEDAEGMEPRNEEGERLELGDEGKGKRDIERQENGPVGRFQ